MSCIRYKFKTALEYDKVTFDGLQISVSELREKIMSLKKMNLSDNLTLDIMDAQTKKIYSNDSIMIPRNSTVVVMRVPKPQKPSTQIKNHQDNFLLSAEELKQMPNLAEADASEEDKVRAMMSQAGEDYNPTTYAKFKARSGAVPAAVPASLKVPPPNYVCHRCNQKGHLIKYCPTNGDPAYDNMRLKRSSGIPNSHVSVAASSSVPGAMIDRFGNVVVRKVDLAAASTERKVAAAVSGIKEEVVPPELTCPICKELVQDAVIILCCSESYCDSCIRTYLLENDFTCFSCKETDISPETLVPNKSLRASAKKFQSHQVTKKGFALARGLPTATVAPPTSVVMATREATPPLVVPSSALPLALSLPSSAVITSDSNPVASNDSPASVTIPSESSTLVPTAASSSQATTSSLSSSSQEPSTTEGLESSQKSSPSQSSALTNEQDTSAPTGSEEQVTTTNGVIGGEEDRTPPVSRDRTPSPSAGLLGSAPPSLTSTGPLLFTSAAESQASPKSLITAPIVIPPAMHRFPSTRPQSSVLLPSFPVVPPIAAAAAAASLGVHPFLPPTRPTADPSVMRLGELLAAADKRTSSPPPLSAEEFYLQQKMFRNIARSRSRSGSFSSRSHSPYSSHSFSSRSPSPLYGRSRSPRSRTSGSGSKTHKRRHHRHRSPEERGKKKRKEEEVGGASEKPHKSHKHKHHHKKKKRKHSHSSPLPREEAGGTGGVALLGGAEDQVGVVLQGEVNGEVFNDDGHEDKERKSPLPEAAGDDNGTAMTNKDHTPSLAPPIPGREEAPVVTSVVKIKKKKKHKEKKDREPEVLKSSVPSSSSSKSVHHHKRHKHTHAQPIATSKHHSATSTSTSSRKKLKKSSRS